MTQSLLNPEAIQKPTLLLNKDIAKRNIFKMAEKAAESQVRFRPHFKTHQSAVIGEWFREAGVEAITVSSVTMAQYFARHGWKDITIAFPVNPREIDALNKLAATAKLNLLVESRESALFLRERLDMPVKIWLETDTGYHRTGISWNNTDEMTAILSILKDSKNCTFSGLLTHSGHSYHARSTGEIVQIYRDTVTRMQKAKDALASKGFSGAAISIGDTPTCSLMPKFDGVDEIRPGNFVFYDIMQTQLGSCTVNDLAVAVACPVISNHPERSEIILYGGAVHLSKERISVSGSATCYGFISTGDIRIWSPPIPDCRLINLSQEHGILQAGNGTASRIGIGELVLVWPVHSCLVVNLLREYVTLEGDRIPTLLSSP